MKIIYLHDWKQSPDARHIQLLAKDYDIFAPQLSDDPNEAYAQVDSLVREHYEGDIIFFCVGLSAIWANEIYKQYSLAAAFIFINPCINPRADLGLEFESNEPLEDWFISDKTALFLQEDTNTYTSPVEKEHEGHFFSVNRFTAADSEQVLNDAIKQTVHDLHFHLRMYRLTHLFDWGNRSWPSLAKITNLISHHLFTLDPMDTGCVQHKYFGEYDYIAWQVMWDIFGDMPLQYALNKYLSYYYGMKPTQSMLNELEQRILPFPPALSEQFEQDKEHIFIPQCATDSDKTLSEEQKEQLFEFNKRLSELEKSVVQEVILRNAELEERVADPNDWLADYDINIEMSFYLREDDPEWKDDKDCYISITFEAPKALLAIRGSKAPSAYKPMYVLRPEANFCSLPAEHPLSTFRHCWYFHQLYAVKQVSFQNLLRIGTVWADVIVDKRFHAVEL